MEEALRVGHLLWSVQRNTESVSLVAVCGCM